MPLSPFFLNGSPSEQRLVQDLVNEHLQLFGQDILYLPRKIINQNTVIREITASKFDDSFRLEAYLVNTDGFGTPSDVLTKFGVKDQDEITLVAVSKRKSSELIEIALDNMINNFGENYAQELHEKAIAIKSSNIVWHFIGPMQSNKVKIIARHAHWIHTIDREKIIKRLNSECKKLNKIIITAEIHLKILGINYFF